MSLFQSITSVGESNDTLLDCDDMNPMGAATRPKKNGVDVDDVDHLASALRILRPTGPSRTASCQRNCMNLWVLYGPILSGGDQVLVPGSNARLIG